MARKVFSKYQGPPATDLAPDDDCTMRFLSWWFRACTFGYIEIAWVNHWSGQPTLFKRFDLADIAEAAAFAAHTNAQPGVSMYFRAATVRPSSVYTSDTDIMQVPGVRSVTPTKPGASNGAPASSCLARPISEPAPFRTSAGNSGGGPTHRSLIRAWCAPSIRRSSKRQVQTLRRPIRRG